MEKDNQTYFVTGVVSIIWIALATILIFSETKGDRAFGVVMFLVAIGALAWLCFTRPQKTGKVYNVFLHTLPGEGARLAAEIRPYTTDSSVENTPEGLLSFRVDKVYAPDIMWILEREPLYSIEFTQPTGWGEED